MRAQLAGAPPRIENLPRRTIVRRRGVTLAISCAGLEFLSSAATKTDGSNPVPSAAKYSRSGSKLSCDCSKRRRGCQERRRPPAAFSSPPTVPAKWCCSRPGRPHSRHPDRKAAIVGVPVRARIRDRPALPVEHMWRRDPSSSCFLRPPQFFMGTGVLANPGSVASMCGMKRDEVG